MNVKYLAVILVLTVICTRFERSSSASIWRRYLRFLPLAVIVFLPALRRDSYILFHVAILCLFLFLERWAPRTKYELGGDWSFQGGIHYGLKYLSLPILSYLFMARGNIGGIWRGSPPRAWGLQAHGVPLWAQAIVALFLLDFMDYVVHRGQHKVEIWWKIHQLHHSTEEVSVLAGFFHNPFEFWVSHVWAAYLVANLVGLSNSALIYGHALPVFFFGLVFAHANIDFPKIKNGHLPWYGYVFCTPNSHAVHHVLGSNHPNYGQVFVFWDVLFGTFRVPSGGPARYGLEDKTMANGTLWSRQLESMTGIFPFLRRFSGSPLGPR